MGKNSGLNNVLLLDNYGEDSRMLHQAFRASGFKGKVFVIEDSGFLPDDVTSIYRYFCGPFRKKKGIPGKPRYFNQIEIPDYWEIETTNSNGKIMNLYQQRGSIFYTEPAHKRLVSFVDWMDEHGVVRSTDHYDSNGALYARTTFSKKGQRFCKSYYDADKREVIVENFVTGDIILNRDNKVNLFRNKVDLIKYLFHSTGVSCNSIYYNSLSTPFFVSESLTSDEKTDILFWQEGVRNDIPGNMQIILQGRATRTARIFVQKKDSYEKLIELGASPDIVKPLGFVYNYESENNGGKDVLICTNSDQIEQLEYLVQHMPALNIHIAAITEMSSKLMAMSKYENVYLYPGVKTKILEELFRKCDLYLDINHANEIVSSVKTAFLNNQLILGFSNTLHNRDYIANEHIFTSADAMLKVIDEVMSDKKVLKNHLELQKQHAMAEDTVDYKKIFE